MNLLYNKIADENGVIDGFHFIGIRETEFLDSEYDPAEADVLVIPEDVEVSTQTWIPWKYKIVDYPDSPTLVKKSDEEFNELVNQGEKIGQIMNLNSQREEEKNSGFEFNGNMYDSDAVSLQNINGVVTRALIAKDEGDIGYTEQWITKDNTVVTLNIDDIIGLGKTATTFVSNIYKKYKALKDAV